MERKASITTTRERTEGPGSDVVCVDLFCGAGGLTEGLLDAGVKVVAGVDFDEACKYPYEANHDGIVFHRADVAELEPSKLDDWFGDAHVRVLAGCAPCQPFSNYALRYQKAEDGNDVENDERWSLLEHFGRLVTKMKPRPDIVTMENVPTVTKHSVFRQFESTLERLGYKVWVDVIDCAKYGLPQRRHRTVLLASLHGHIKLRDPAASETRFQVRPVEGVDLPPNTSPEELILDGQQRLTSLTQVLKFDKPVATRDGRKHELKRHYYFDIEKALAGGPEALGEAIVAVDEQRTQRDHIGKREVTLDLTTREKEIENFHFPCSQIMNSDDWEQALADHAPTKLAQFMKFRKLVVEPFRNYALPVISLKKETSKEAVCLVFEKVNTGGVPLSVFELITATWAADGFNLRDDWFGERGKSGRHARLSKKPLLRDLQPTDFLQGVSLLHSFERRKEDLAAGRTGKEVAGVTAKREHVLETPLAAFHKWAEPLTKGHEQAERFLRSEGFHHPKFLPYRTQLTPLGAVLAHLGDRWLEPQIKTKLARWFWCGVLGELYGGAVETRIALDVQQLLAWVNDPTAPEPATVQAAGFNPNRLDTLRSRTSAAYRGLYVLLQREGARDFFWKARMIDLDLDDVKLDIHHIFPKKWCTDADIPPRVFNAIVNKTAISYKANRKIGGSAPSKYLAQLQSEAQVKLSDAEMDEILKSHVIDPTLLRADAFQKFYDARKAALLAIVERAMGKASAEASNVLAEDEDDDEEEGEAA